MTEVERLAEGIRRADQAGDAEAVRVLGARDRQLQQTQPVAAPETAPGVKTRVPVVTGEIGGPPVRVLRQSRTPGGSFCNRSSRTYPRHRARSCAVQPQSGG